MKKRFTFFLTAIFLVSSFVLPGFAWAQKGGDKNGPSGIFESRKEYEQFMGGLKSLRDPEVDAMLPALNDMMLGRPIGKTAQQYNIGGNPVMTLLADKSIRKELEVVDDQVEEIKRLNRQLQERLSKEVRSMDLTDSAQVISTIRDITESAQADMEDVFLPHQLDRLKQLGVRHQMNRQSVLGALLTDPLASELGLTEEQKDELRQTAKKIESELARELEELKIKARQQLFSCLTREQQQKLDDLIGDEYRFSVDAFGIAKRPDGRNIGGGKGKSKKPKFDKKKPRQ